jgi:hypothetical protein
MNLDDAHNFYNLFEKEAPFSLCVNTFTHIIQLENCNFLRTAAVKIATYFLKLNLCNYFLNFHTDKLIA